MNDAQAVPRSAPGEVPWDDLDPGIYVVVSSFVAAGFDTIASCQGHGEGDAWVVIEPVALADRFTEIDRVIGLIRANGWDQNCIVEHAMVLNGPDWIRVRWWGQVPFR